MILSQKLIVQRLQYECGRGRLCPMSINVYGGTILNCIYELYLVIVIVYRNGFG